MSNKKKTKTAETTVNLIGNKVVKKITENLWQNNSEKTECAIVNIKHGSIDLLKCYFYSKMKLFVNTSHRQVKII